MRLRLRERGQDGDEVQQRRVAAGPLDPEALGHEEDPERGERDADAPLELGLRDPLQRLAQPRARRPHEHRGPPPRHAPAATTSTAATAAPTSAGAGPLGRAASAVTITTISKPSRSTPLKATRR